MTPEGALKRDCRALAKKAGLLWWNVEGKGVNGVPDTVCGRMQGGIVFIEFKRPDGQGVVSEQQYRRIGELLMAGQDAQIVQSIAGYRRAVGL